MTDIHPSAIVHPKVKLGKGVKIGPFSVINSPKIILEEGVVIKGHVHIDGFVHIKKYTKIYPFASIGSPPQKHNYDELENNPIEIGESCEIREYVSINSSHGAGEKVIIGDKCFIMAYCHIAHNCILGSHITMANGATLAGHVVVGDHANLGGLCAVHQRCRIGDYAMIGGGSMIGTDVPPFSLGSGYPIRLHGLNWIGLKRKKIPHLALKTLVKAYRLTYQSGVRWEEAREEILLTMEMNPYLQKWVEFCDQSTRGLASAKEKKFQATKNEERESKYPELVEIG